MVNLKFSSIREALHFRMTVSEDHFFVEEYWDAAADCCGGQDKKFYGM